MRRDALLLLLLLVGLLLALVPIALMPTLPLMDYPGHLARLYLLDHAEQSPYLHEYYRVNWQFLPNLAFELISRPLAAHLGVDAAGRVFLALTFAVQLAGVVALNVVLNRRLSVIVLLALMLLYGRLFTNGFLSFGFGLGLSLCCLAAWIRWREVGFLPRFLAFSVAGCALLICHLFALGLYGLAVLCWEANRAWKKRTRRLAGLLALADGLAQFVVPTALFLALSPTASSLGLAGPTDPRQRVAAWAAPVEFYSPSLQLAVVVVAAMLLLWACHRRFVRILLPMWLVIGTLALLVCCGPDRAASGSILLPRFAVAAAFLTVASVDLRLSSPSVERRWAAGLLLLFAMYVAFIAATWGRFQASYRALDASFEHLHRGAKVNIVIEYCGTLQDLLEPPFHHALELAISRREVFVPTMVTEARQQPVVYQPGYAPLARRNSAPVVACGTLLEKRPQAGQATSAALRADLAADFDYLYVVAEGLSGVLPPRDFRQVFDGGRFRLYQRTGSREGVGDAEPARRIPEAD